jgi:hypothetical protein
MWPGAAATVLFVDFSFQLIIMDEFSVKVKQLLASGLKAVGPA